MPEIIVEMDQCAFTNRQDTLLTTEGVCTCIAFIIYGAYWDEDDNLINFRGLYHWSGFEIGTKNPLENARTTLSSFLNKLRIYCDVEEEQSIHINTLAFIGGEKEQRDNADQIILTGTEAEVYALTTVLQDYNFTGFNINREAISHHHFLTSNDQSLTLILAANQYRCIREDNAPEYNDDSDNTYSA